MPDTIVVDVATFRRDDREAVRIVMVAPDGRALVANLLRRVGGRAPTVTVARRDPTGAPVEFSAEDRRLAVADFGLAEGKRLSCGASRLRQSFDRVDLGDVYGRLGAENLSWLHPEAGAGLGPSLLRPASMAPMQPAPSPPGAVPAPALAALAELSVSNPRFGRF